MNVMITGVEGTLGQQFAKQLAAAGHAIIGTDLLEHDVTCEKDWQKFVEAWEVDVLINNAGTKPILHSVERIDPFAAWEQTLHINLTGTMLGCKTLGQHWISRSKQGCIINIANQYGIVSPHLSAYHGTGSFLPAAYSVSKAGVLGLTRYLACLWGSYGIRVNAISPGDILEKPDQHYGERLTNRLSNLNPMGRMADPDEIADAALFLISATYVNGANIVVDGGWSIW